MNIKQEILINFDEKFGKCNLSICDEHEKIRCAKCRFKDFLSQSIDRVEDDILNNYFDWWSEWRADCSHKLEYPDNSKAYDFIDWVKEFKLKSLLPNK